MIWILAPQPIKRLKKVQFVFTHRSFRSLEKFVRPFSSFEKKRLFYHDYCNKYTIRTHLKMLPRFTRQAIRRASSLPPHALKPAFGAGDKEAARTFKQSLEATQHHAKETTGLWKKITVFVAIPAIALAAVNTYFVEAEHARHREHLKHVPDSDWPKDYEFQNIRTKPFFWGDGDKTMFWNPVVNRNVSHDE